MNVALNLILVPSMGAEGAGIALVLSELLSLVVVGLWLRRITRYDIPWGFAARLLLPIALTAAVLWLARDQQVLARMLLLGGLAGAVTCDAGRGQRLRLPAPAARASAPAL